MNNMTNEIELTAKLALDADLQKSQANNISLAVKYPLRDEGFTDAAMAYIKLAIDQFLKEVVIVYCDGSCLGKLGWGPSGWCAILQHPETKAEKIIKGGSPHTTNNQMELTAALMALDAIKEDVPIIIYTDSQYVEKGAMEWSKRWLQNDFRTVDKKPVKNQKLWKALLNHRHFSRVSFIKVKAHSGHTENGRADRFARSEAERFQEDLLKKQQRKCTPLRPSQKLVSGFKEVITQTDSV